MEEAAFSRAWGKNVVMLIADDLRPAFSSFGEPFASTPNIDRLASRGVRFSRSFVQASECGPSRASFMTGRRPDSTGIINLRTILRRVNPKIVTLAQVFKANHYRVFGAGKLQDGRNVPNEDFDSKPPSFDEFPAYDSNDTFCFDRKRPVCSAALGWDPKSCHCMVSPGVIQVPGDDAVPAVQDNPAIPDHAFVDERMGTFEAARLTQLLTDNDPNPFLHIVGFFKPHLPFVAPSHYFDALRNVATNVTNVRLTGPRNKWTLDPVPEVLSYGGFNPASQAARDALYKGYLACAAFVDRQIGKMLDAYDAAGPQSKRDDTIILFLADHGFHLGENGWWGKHTNLDFGTRIGLIIAPPAYVTPATRNSEWRPNLYAGRVERTPVELVDILPTLIDLTGLRVAEPGLLHAINPDYPVSPGMSLIAQANRNIQGKSLRSLLLPAPTAAAGATVPPRPSYFAVSQFLRPKGVMGYTIRTSRYRLVQWFSGTDRAKPLAVELYDYAVDGPIERVNRVNDQPKVAQALQSLFAMFMKKGRVEYDALKSDLSETAGEDLRVVNAALTREFPLPANPGLPSFTPVFHGIGSGDYSFTGTLTFWRAVPAFFTDSGDASTTVSRLQAILARTVSRFATDTLGAAAAGGLYISLPVNIDSLANLGGGNAPASFGTVAYSFAFSNPAHRALYTQEFQDHSRYFDFVFTQELDAFLFDAGVFDTTWGRIAVSSTGETSQPGSTESPTRKPTQALQAIPIKD